MSSVKCLVLVSGLLLGAGCTIPEKEKTSFSVENKTTTPMVFRASMGGLSRSIVLGPGETWNGWIWTPLLKSSGRVKFEVFTPER